MFYTLKDWITGNKRDVTIGIMTILIAILSFGLGYLANREFNHVPIIVEKCSGLNK